MNDTNSGQEPHEPERLESLIDAYLEGDLDGEELEELSQELLSSQEARKLFWTMARHRLRIERWARESWGAATARSDLDPADARQRRSFGRGVGRVRSSPRAAIVAFGAVCSLVGAGVALALTPIQLSPVRQPLPVANPGFEDPLVEWTTDGELGRPPLRIGEWSGDIVRAVPASCGVKPCQGRQMLAFEKGLPDRAGITQARGCDLFQVIDVRPFLRHASESRTTLAVTARFHEAAEGGPPLKRLDEGVAAGQASGVSCRVFVFAGAVEDVVENWPGSINSAIAHGFAKKDLPPVALHLGEAADDWHRLDAETLLPPSATFAVVHVSADCPEDRPADAADCPIAFCDDVRAEIVTYDEARPSRGSYYWALMTGQDFRPGPLHGR